MSRLTAYKENTAVILISTLLTLFTLGWLGYDLRALPVAIIGDHSDPARDHNEAAYNYYMLYQAYDNLLSRPTNPGYSLLFYDDENSYAYASGHYGIALQMLPFYFLSGKNLILTYNLYLILTFSLTTWGAYLLVSYLVDPPFPVALLVGLVVTFTHLRMVHILNLENLSAHLCWFSLYAFHRLLDNQRWRWLTLLGLCLGLLLITSGYLAMSLLIMLPVILIYRVLRGKGTTRHLTAISGAAAIALLIALPFLLFRFQNAIFTQGQGYSLIARLSARPVHWISGASWIFGGYESTPSSWIFKLFVGAVPLLFTLIGMALYWRLDFSTESKPARGFSSWQIVELYLMLTFIGYVLSLGPELPIGESFVIPLPYRLLWFLPGFSSLRVVTRFVLLAVVGTSVVMAATFTWLLDRLHKESWKPWLIITVAMLLVIEFFPADRYRQSKGDIPPKILQTTLRDYESPLVKWLASLPADTAIVHYPFSFNHDSSVLPYLPYYELPTLNGAAALFPDWYPNHPSNINLSTQHLVLMHQRNIRYMIVYPDAMTEDDYQDFMNRLARLQSDYDAFRLVELFDDAEVYAIQIDLPQAAFFDFDDALSIRDGWSRPEVTKGGQTVIRTAGPQATVRLMLEPAQDALLSFHLADSRQSETYPSLAATINGESAALEASQDSGDGISYLVEISREVLSLSPGVVEITFTIEQPSDGSEEPEQDGIMFDWLQIIPASR